VLIRDYDSTEKNDNEVRTTEQLYALRKQVVRLHLEGLPVMQIVAMTGLSWPGARASLSRYEAGGMAALKPAIRGKKPGTGRSLNSEQEQAICRIICDKRPEQLKMEFALWSRAAVGQLIEQEYAIKLHVRSVGKYLARWGFTPQKPIKKAYKHRPGAVQQWLDEQYPAIAERAKAEGGEIHWGDETALVNTDVRGRSYAPAGKTPGAYAVGGIRQKLSMLATVTNQGKAALDDH
jgi:transposase